MLNSTLPAPTTNPLWFILLLIILILINAFFAASELAVVSLNPNKLKKLSDEGDKKARILYQMVNIPTSFLATIQIGVTLSGFLASAVAADTFAEYLIYYLAFLPISPDLLKGGSILIITLLLSFFTLIFGELVPKRLAMQNADRIAFNFAPILNTIYVLFKPLVFLLSITTNGVAALFGVSAKDNTSLVSEEDIRIMVDASSEDGNIEAQQKEMIHNIFEFDNRDVVEIMTHRIHIIAVEQNASIYEAVDKSIEYGFSRIPVYDGEIDTIIGILFIKDLLEFMNKEVDTKALVKDYMREATFVFESSKCDDVFKLLTENKIQMAIISDEYGGTYGLVTMEDLLESIVGKMEDEFDEVLSSNSIS